MGLFDEPLKRVMRYGSVSSRAKALVSARKNLLNIRANKDKWIDTLGEDSYKKAEKDFLDEIQALNMEEMLDPLGELQREIAEAKGVTMTPGKKLTVDYTDPDVAGRMKLPRKPIPKLGGKAEEAMGLLELASNEELKAMSQARSLPEWVRTNAAAILRARTRDTAPMGYGARTEFQPLGEPPVSELTGGDVTKRVLGSEPSAELSLKKKAVWRRGPTGPVPAPEGVDPQFRQGPQFSMAQGEMGGPIHPSLQAEISSDMAAMKRMEALATPEELRINPTYQALKKKLGGAIDEAGPIGGGPVAGFARSEGKDRWGESIGRRGAQYGSTMAKRKALQREMEQQTDYVVYLHDNKDDIVSQLGQEHWDKELAITEKRARELERQMKNLGKLDVGQGGTLGGEGVGAVVGPIIKAGRYAAQPQSTSAPGPRERGEMVEPSPEQKRLYNMMGMGVQTASWIMDPVGMAALKAAEATYTDPPPPIVEGGRIRFMNKSRFLEKHAMPDTGGY